MKILIVFVIFFLFNKILCSLPIIYPEVRINNWNANWNWTGKIYAIIGTIIFLLIYRKYPLSDYFFTFKQNKKFLKKGVFLIISILLIQIVTAFYSSSKPLSLETLFFQYSIPGIDEEIAYRGIMLGLLVKVLKSKNLILNPSVWITAILFGMVHGFFLSKNFEVIFEFQPFLWTTVYGLIWGWMTIKSGSILLALISHNLGNGTLSLIQMR
ncbi:CPBP family intramembrane glutamic endopeptidase [uncultured Tenacibaculum sp.]|uniref:CPBP family intramembrane glutamic endopeptidase n=1 Tax=uncultured Tenacibaculum sp. TaxID=174713 RepID=UPI002617C866|nr:CPBP family intramembrane glutamic endopeptidase [uncultured Tenacibaculum sp.]